MSAGRVLVVDDALVNRKLIERLLREQGAHRHRGGDGFAALESLGASLAWGQPRVGGVGGISPAP